MPTILGPRFDSTFTGTPAHMSPEDYSIFQVWFPTVKEQISAVYFDVGLGEGTPAPDNAPANYKKMWLHNTQKRADVVWIGNGPVHIVELRFNASLNAIGRLLGYKELYLNHPLLGENLILDLVTNYRDEDVARVAHISRINYIVV